ncbi:MAG: thioredoxin TrxC [Rhodobacterales bacterium]|nr:thioredoxin TrxC [Rhodobacterales bacterium]
MAKKVTCLQCAQVNRVPDEKLGKGAKCGTCGVGLFSAKVTEIDLPTLKKAARNDDVPLVVDFWAPWCGPCKMMGPQFSQAAGQLSGLARLVKLNTEEHPKAGALYGIRGIPTMVGFKGGKETKRQSGAMQAGAIINWARQV